MQQFNFLEKLLNYEPAGDRVISVYLNTGPNETGKKDFEIFLRKQINEHAGVLEADSPEREAYDAAAEKIDTFVEQLDPATKGAAFFVSVGSDGLSERFEFAIPFDQNAFEMSDRPALHSAMRLVSENPVFAVIAADTNSAHIYVFKRGQTINVEDIQNTKTNRTEVGGWSQMRYQRHIDNFHQQHAKEVIAEAEKLCRDEKIDRVILSGDEAVIIPMLKGELSKEMSEKVIGALSLNVSTPENEIMEAAAELIREKEVEFDVSKVENLMEQNYDKGLGITGVEKTLIALMNGQVQELYIASDPTQIVYNRSDLRQVLKAYEPGEDGELPEAAERDAVIEELLRRAAGTADNIRFISDPHLLKTHGGVGALLRYRAEGVAGV
jgi:peptide chain release factor subunit 1